MFICRHLHVNVNVSLIFQTQHLPMTTLLRQHTVSISESISLIVGSSMSGYDGVVKYLLRSCRESSMRAQTQEKPKKWDELHSSPLNPGLIRPTGHT